MNLMRALDITSISTNYRAGILCRIQCVLGCLAGLILLASCNSKQYLRPDQSFLRDNKLTIASKHKIDNKSELKEALITLYTQPETKTVAGIPRHEFYYQLQRRIAKDSLNPKWREDRYQQKLLKNRPVIYDSAKAEQTTLVFENYLKLRGYRFSDATYRAGTNDKETTVHYHVDPGPRLYIDTFQIIAEDSSLQRILDSIPKPEFIRPGSPLDINLYTQEKNRIVRVFQNLGYATVDQNYIPNLEVDTAGQRVKAIMRVRNPTDSTYHKRYYVGSVTLYPDYYNEFKFDKTYYDTIVDLITYWLPDSLVFTLKPDAIHRNVFVIPGHLSKRDDFEQTRRSLVRMELAGFVGATYELDTALRLIHYVFRIERKSKINLQGIIDLTYSNVAATQKRNLLGTAVSIDYRDRNMFKGAEVFGLNLEAGLEFNFLNRDVAEDEVKPSLINSVNIGAGTNFSFPRFMDPLRMYSMLGYRRDPQKPAIIFDRLGSWLRQDANSRLSAGYSYVSIQDLYEYYTFNTNLSYVMQPDVTRKLTLDRIGFDLFVPDPKPAFDEILSKNRFQRESFGKQLYTGLLFRSWLFELNGKSLADAKAKPDYIKLIHSFELSGLEVWALNSLVAPKREFVLRSKSDTGIDSIEFSHFAKAEIDLTYFYEFGAKSQLAFNITTGVAAPFGTYTNQVPYLKQFYVGGAQSNRGWQIRELGPGAYEDTAVISSNLPFYQTGDIKIDLTLEYGFPLFWLFNGAFFVDAANVWTMNDPDRTAANFKFDKFYKQFGVGYGFGVRADFDFFVIRLDFGYKLINPYRVMSSNGKFSQFLYDEVKRFPAGAEIQLAIGPKN